MMTRGTYWSPFRSWERNKKVAIKHGFEGARSASCHEIDCELCASASPLEESTASLLLVSCTHGCSGQRCTETFLLRFRSTLCEAWSWPNIVLYCNVLLYCRVAEGDYDTPCHTTTRRVCGLYFPFPHARRGG